MAKAKPWYETAGARKPPDVRDAEEHAAVAAALRDLHADHAARRASAEGADTIKLTHLAADRREIVEALTQAYLAGWRRSLARWSAVFSSRVRPVTASINSTMSPACRE